MVGGKEKQKQNKNKLFSLAISMFSVFFLSFLQIIKSITKFILHADSFYFIILFCFAFEKLNGKKIAVQSALVMVWICTAFEPCCIHSLKVHVRPFSQLYVPICFRVHVRPFSLSYVDMSIRAEVRSPIMPSLKIYRTWA